MKRYFLLAVFFLASILVCAQPKLEIIEGKTVDWGEVSPKDNPLEREINVKNTGNETLEITEIKPSCGCTTAPLSKNILEPGETATLPIKLRVDGNAGEVKKTIRVTSNDPQNPSFNILLVANVVRALAIEPTFIGFGDLQVGSESEGMVKIKNTSDEEISLWNFKVEPKDIKLNIDNNVTIKPGDEFLLKVRVVPSGKGRFSSKITMETSHKDFKELTIFGYGSVKPSPIFINN